jgi:hypothetical protein
MRCRKRQINIVKRTKSSKKIAVPPAQSPPRPITAGSVFSQALVEANAMLRELAEWRVLGGDFMVWLEETKQSTTFDDWRAKRQR